MLTIIFPSSYFSDKKVDEELEAEYNAAVGTGLFDIALFSYDKWFNEGKMKLDKHFDKPVTAVYRGWMMKPEKYYAFYHELKNRNISLLTSPEAYELFHIFPNIYPSPEQIMAVIQTNTEFFISEVRRQLFQEIRDSIFMLRCRRRSLQKNIKISEVHITP